MAGWLGAEDGHLLSYLFASLSLVLLEWLRFKVPGIDAVCFWVSVPPVIALGSENFLGFKINSAGR